MSDKYVEKNFLYLVLLSLFVHLAVAVLLVNLPEKKRAAVSEPFMVDLEGIPELSPPKETSSVQRPAEERRRVEREVAPRGESFRDKFAQPARVQAAPRMPPGPTVSRVPQPAPRESLSRDELFRKKGSNQPPEISSLYPDASRMARLEESYRKKYGPEVAEGETRFLNTEDILFGSFLRRFENAVYGVWRYPAEAAKMGIEGITPVKITFNQRGEIVGTELLQSSGSKILDNEVLRTLRQIGPVGTFPKGYEKETFNLIAFFHYGLQGTVRSLH